MTSKAISWLVGNAVHVADLADRDHLVVGRSSPEADIVVEDASVSRQHLALRRAGPGYVLEHLSKTNPTRVNGTEVSGQVVLADGDRILIGPVRATFHDLAAKDRHSGPICHVCHRENESEHGDCWYCGTSLVNAPTTIRQPRPDLCRVIAPDGSFADLYANTALVLSPDASVTSVRVEHRSESDSAWVAAIDGRVVFRDVVATGAVDYGLQPVETGARLVVDPVTFTVLVR